jgi:hypothetical protein
MVEIKSYENFPIWIPLVAIFVSIISYILGAIILLGFGIIIAVFYLVYCLGVEMLVIFRSCKYCYYYNRLCGLGKGKIAPLFTKKGDPKKFTEREVTFSDLIPDFLVTIFPIVGGVILSVIDFSFTRLGLIIIFMILSFGGTAIIRGNLACKYCKQREIGCPAQQFFSKKK